MAGSRNRQLVGMMLIAMSLGCLPNSPSDDLSPTGDVVGAEVGTEVGRAVEDAWLEFVRSKMGKYRLMGGVPSPHWLVSEQEKRSWYDLATTYLPDDAIPESVEVVPELGDTLRVVTQFRNPIQDSVPTWRSSMTVTVYAVPSGNRWAFLGAIDRRTRSWRRQSVGPITYVMRPDQTFDVRRAERAGAFMDSVAIVFSVPRLTDVTYYLTSSPDEAFRLMGLESAVSYGPVGGFAIPINREVFSANPAIGEEYRHELAHLVLMPLIGHTSYFLSEGVATWIGGTLGMDFPTVARRLAAHLTANPELTLNAFMEGVGEREFVYTAAAMIVAMAYDYGGVAAIKGLLDSGTTAGDLQATLADMLGVTWLDIKSEWRSRLVQESAL